MIEKLSVFLIGWMGGPQKYNKRFGRIIIPAAHQPFDIGEAERDQWLLCMRKALAVSPLDKPMQKATNDVLWANGGYVPHRVISPAAWRISPR